MYMNLQWGDHTFAILAFIANSANLKESDNTVSFIFFDQCFSLIDSWHFVAKALVMFDVRRCEKHFSWSFQIQIMSTTT